MKFGKFSKEILDAYAEEVTRQMNYYNNMTREQRVEYYEAKAQEAKEKIDGLKSKIEAVGSYWAGSMGLAISIFEKEIKEAEESADYYRNGGLTLREILADETN